VVGALWAPPNCIFLVGTGAVREGVLRDSYLRSANGRCPGGGSPRPFPGPRRPLFQQEERVAPVRPARRKLHGPRPCLAFGGGVEEVVRVCMHLHKADAHARYHV
jgi:hypothetical protein